MDPNPRPLKRLRSVQHPETLKPLPEQHLLLALPSLLIHPPGHKFYALSLYWSLHALRSCLCREGCLDALEECRAWTAFAELGMKAVEGVVANGCTGEWEWAKGINNEAEKAISKGLIIAQKHPSLSSYRPRLILLQSRLLAHTNLKFARTQLKRLLNTFPPSTPPHTIYTAHLAYIHSLSSSSNPTQTLDAVKALQDLATTNNHAHIVLLTHVLRLRLLIANDTWDQSAVSTAETALGISYEVSAEPQAQPDASQFATFTNPFENTMAVHVLVMSIAFYTRAGMASQTNPRLLHLHALMDECAGDGIVHADLGDNVVGLGIQTTHPKILGLLGYLVSACEKRDAVGRKPKRQTFAREGIAMCEVEMEKEVPLPVWAGMTELRDVQMGMVKIKADLLCELIAVTILRSDFSAAQTNLSELISYTRTHRLFESYAARITLHHAHLAHALGQADRALMCYRVAAELDKAEGGFVWVAGRAGEIALRLGMQAEGDEGEGEDLKKMGWEVVGECKGMGGTLEAVGQVIEACLVGEIIKAKKHLRTALLLASRAQDNHLRCIVLAFISSHYLHTEGELAREMLGTCEQLAVGLGASEKKGEKVVGNAGMRLWVGQRFLEMYKREGDEKKVKKQKEANKDLVKAVEQIVEMGTEVN